MLLRINPWIYEEASSSWYKAKFRAIYVLLQSCDETHQTRTSSNKVSETLESTDETDKLL
jgi:hypothetical protein